MNDHTELLLASERIKALEERVSALEQFTAEVSLRANNVALLASLMNDRLKRLEKHQQAPVDDLR